ncbi:MAG: DUF2325 domain-containing protein [Burkholderiales bacterium]|nr:DUF2325 domain-containing protein [Burkholderiales bacterium]
MCDHDAKQPLTLHFAAHGFSIPALTFAGSRRRRIWELPQHCHCPVVGVCLPLDVLRRLVNKSLEGQALADDYDMHVGAVAECTRRSRLSESLQRELERRYASTIQHFRRAKSAEAVLGLWTQAVELGDVAGAFWAALTHPRCDEALQELLCRDMHMIQHQVGASVRADLAKLKSVMEENGILSRELGRVQERTTRLLCEKSSEIERLNAQLMHMRAENIGKETTVACLQADLEELRAAIPDLESRERLQQKLDQLIARNASLEAQAGELKKKLAVAMREETKNGELSDTSKNPAPEVTAPRAFPITPHLREKTVLCVGGRSGSIASYRDLIERIGGRFAHHDGGMEDNPNQLVASLTAADLVICQTGCISHSAYWRVKDFCKRTGKRCVFVENPSASSLARGLEQLSDCGGHIDVEIRDGD